MDRRKFLRFLSTGSAVAVAPSLVWPFRKIFLPAVQPFTSFWMGTLQMYDRPDFGRLTGIGYTPTGLFECAEITYLSVIRTSDFDRDPNAEELKRSFDSFLRGVEVYANVD